jgi:hypothetical protein
MSYKIARRWAGIGFLAGASFTTQRVRGNRETSMTQHGQRVAVWSRAVVAVALGITLIVCGKTFVPPSDVVARAFALMEEVGWANGMELRQFMGRNGLTICELSAADFDATWGHTFPLGSPPYGMTNVDGSGITRLSRGNADNPSSSQPRTPPCPRRKLPPPRCSPAAFSSLRTSRSRSPGHASRAPGQRHR